MVQPWPYTAEFFRSIVVLSVCILYTFLYRRITCFFGALYPSFFPSGFLTQAFLGRILTVST